MNQNNVRTDPRFKKRALAGIFITLTLLIMQACGTSNELPEGARIIEDTPTRVIPTITPYVTATIPAADFLTATASALQAHEGAVRFMSYNVTDGALDKIADITAIIKAYNPDVLAVQEANGWQANDFEIANQVSTELGMQYAACQSTAAATDKNGNTFDVLLFSKLEILGSEAFTNVENCLIRAEIAMPNGTSVQVFATQLNPDFDASGCTNVENLIKASEGYTSVPAILLGDMTMPPPGIELGYPLNQVACPPLLEDAGWNFFTDVSRADHVWATEALLAFESYKLPGPNKEPLVSKNSLRNASEHSPLAVDFYFP